MRNKRAPRGRNDAPAVTPPAADIGSDRGTVPLVALAQLAAEVWRLGRRIEATPDASDRFVDSHRRLVRVLDDLGIRIDDPFGRLYIEGMNAEVVDVPMYSGSERDSFVVSEVLRPAIFFGGQCVSVPQIMLARAALGGGPHAGK